MCVQWEQFLELGKDMDNSEVEKIVKNQKPEESAALVYTVSQLPVRLNTLLINPSISLVGNHWKPEGSYAESR